MKEPIPDELKGLPAYLQQQYTVDHYAIERDETALKNEYLGLERLIKRVSQLTGFTSEQVVKFCIQAARNQSMTWRQILNMVCAFHVMAHMETSGEGQRHAEE